MRMELHETSFKDDVECVRDYFVPVPRTKKGVRVIVGKEDVHG